MSFQASLARGKAEERKLAAYLKALNYRVLPTTEFSGSGAPTLDGEADSIIMPDLQAFKDGAGEWFECKWKSRATESTRYDRLETGISIRHYLQYCRIERETAIPVAIVFVHEKEREVRCGTLNQLQAAFSHDDRSDKMERGGMRFWAWESIPLWMPLEELSSAIVAHQLGARLAEPPVKPPVDGKILARRSHVHRRHIDREPAPNPLFDPYPKNGEAWNWACLACNAVGVGSTSHRCVPRNEIIAFWSRRLRFVFKDKAADEIATIIRTPIDRVQLSAWLGDQPRRSGGNWTSVGDFVE